MNDSINLNYLKWLRVTFWLIASMSVSITQAGEPVNLFQGKPELLAEDQTITSNRFNKRQQLKKTRHLVRPNLEAPLRGDKSLQLELPNNLQIAFERSKFEKRGSKNVLWRGRSNLNADDSMLLTIRNGKLFGRIEVNQDVYEISPMSGDQYSLDLLNLSAFPQCEVEAPDFEGGSTTDFDGMDSNFSPNSAISAEDGEIMIDLLSVYTPRAKAKSGGQLEVEAQIQAAVDNANFAFESSNMNARFRLVHVEEVYGYTLSNDGTTGEALAWVRNDAYVGSLRDAHGADMVSIIVDNAECGRGYLQNNPGSSFAINAFQVTDIDCAVGNLTFAHEHGHNMGMEHNPENSGSTQVTASYPWSFGHYVDGSYRTIMSYSNQCINYCTRVTQFSNPEIFYAGVPTGITGARNNARTGNLTAPIVQDFRQSVIISNIAPTASFTYSVSNFDVVFTDTSVDDDGAVVSWEWDFGDGSTSSLQNPNHSYASSGTYIVELRVTDNDGATSTTSITITISQAPNVPPVASFAYSVSGFSVNFNDLSTDSDGAIVAWSWDFGDGTSSILQTPSNVYSNAGSYLVSLTVTDNDGATSSASQTVMIDEIPNLVPTAEFEFSSVGLDAQFSDLSTDNDGSIVDWLWDFGDGSTTSAQNPAYTYSVAGTYTVSLTVWDDDGAMAQTEKSVTIVETQLNIPNAPTNLTYTLTTETVPGRRGRLRVVITAVTLHWDDNANNEDGVVIERCIPQGGGRRSGTPRTCIYEVLDYVGQDVTLYDAPTVLNHEYRIQAYNTAGASEYSNVVVIRRR